MKSWEQFFFSEPKWCVSVQKSTEESTNRWAANHRLLLWKQGALSAFFSLFLFIFFYFSPSSEKNASGSTFYTHTHTVNTHLLHIQHSWILFFFKMFESGFKRCFFKKAASGGWRKKGRKMSKKTWERDGDEDVNKNPAPLVGCEDFKVPNASLQLHLL